MNHPDAQRAHLSDNPHDFGAAVQQVSTELGIGESLVEKDHWVSEVLRAVEAAAPGAVVFKGGTSLEKLRLINRFSEDLDLLVVADYPSKNAAQRGLKNLCQAAAAAIPGATPTKVGGGGVHPRWLHRAVSLSLPSPSTAPDSLAAPDTVLLELGQAGGRNPASRRLVTSLLSRHAGLLGIADNEFDDIGAFEVTVLHPGRTLIEKLLRVNNFALDEQRRAGIHGWSRIGRQFYDLWALLGDDEVHELLATPKMPARFGWIVRRYRRWRSGPIWNHLAVASWRRQRSIRRRRCPSDSVENTTPR